MNRRAFLQGCAAAVAAGLPVSALAAAADELGAGAAPPPASPAAPDSPDARLAALEARWAAEPAQQPGGAARQVPVEDHRDVAREEPPEFRYVQRLGGHAHEPVGREQRFDPLRIAVAGPADLHEYAYETWPAPPSAPQPRWAASSAFRFARSAFQPSKFVKIFSISVPMSRVKTNTSAPA